MGLLGRRGNRVFPLTHYEKRRAGAKKGNGVLLLYCVGVWQRRIPPSGLTKSGSPPVGKKEIFRTDIRRPRYLFITVRTSRFMVS